jgi:hypothetical protein
VALGRATELGLNVLHWSAGTNKDSIRSADIVVFSVECIDSGAFSALFTELLIAKRGNSCSLVSAMDDRIVEAFAKISMFRL